MCVQPNSAYMANRQILKKNLIPFLSVITINILINLNPVNLKVNNKYTVKKKLRHKWMCI